MVSATGYHRSMHLGEAQLVAAEARCPVCGCEGSGRPRAGVIQREPSVYLLRCERCGACSASHLPTPEVLEAYYGRYFPDDGPKVTMPRVGRFVDRLARAMRIGDAPRRVRILDFGGGDGTLGLALGRRLLEGRRDRTVALSLVDYQAPAAAEPGERLEVAHARTLDEIDGTFDIVIASAILEHVPELRPVMDRLCALLAPDGWFYARTAYVAPLKRLIPALDITYPGHVHDLGAPFWARVPATYRQPLSLVVSRPSLIETDFLRNPAATLAAWLMKLPARAELALYRRPRVPRWRLVGGWEVVLTKQTR